MKAENVVAVVVILAFAGIVSFNLDREELAPVRNALDTGIKGITYYTMLAIDGFADLFSPLLSNTATKGEYVNTGNLNTTIAECKLLESDFAQEGAAYLLALLRVKNVGQVPEHLPILIDMRIYYLGDVIRPKKIWRGEGDRAHYDPLTTDKIYPNVTREGWVCFSRFQ